MLELHRLWKNREGAVTLIGVFMAACLVGAVYYMFGLGEAMLYRQQLRAAADAAAFDSVVVHAMGMNMIAFLNVVMAGLLAIIVFLTFLLILCIAADALTLFTATPIIGPIIAGIFKLITLAKTVIFPTLAALNFLEGVIAIVFPYGGYVTSFLPASQYGGGVTQTWTFSTSMIPTRVPYVSNQLDSMFSKKVGAWVTQWKDAGSSFGSMWLSGVSLKTPLLQRYGLPVQDDTYGVLCMHAGMGATAVVPAVLGLSVPSWILQLGGQVAGYAPWIFCSGMDIGEVLRNLPSGVLSRIESIVGDFKTMQKSYQNMYPMKVFDEAKNGNDFMQVWSTAKGSSTALSGVGQGVAIAAWGSASPAADPTPSTMDNAEAEFYFDCAGPGAKDDVTIGTVPLYHLPESLGNPPAWQSTDDSTGYWVDCKYNAMWNLRWKARLRRVHDAEWDIRRTALLTIYQALGIESLVKAFFIGSKTGVDDGSLAKTSFLDPIKSCFTAIGSGSNSNSSGDFGNCPWSTGTWFGNWGGKIHPWGQSLGGPAVLH